eukprot:NODE_2654_length_660_cov_47.764321_g2184_i0.p2 GENE.NODE_2654_length_660_cov_47.764321_g2184_i0~~NODE_2654_length_660_cov_47.764321_g2184_i0.p2  ORF type:complete len:166 (-),score=19.75 NODE_2654_length_660_cov_47.764321_g2184_i0:25-522(-)
MLPFPKPVACSCAAFAVALFAIGVASVAVWGSRADDPLFETVCRVVGEKLSGKAEHTTCSVTVQYRTRSDPYLLPHNGSVRLGEWQPPESGGVVLWDSRCGDYVNTSSPVCWVDKTEPGTPYANVYMDNSKGVSGNPVTWIVVGIVLMVAGCGWIGALGYAAKDD